jgi:hypothetical protein
MTNPLVLILLTLLPYSTINATTNTLKEPVPIVQNDSKKGLSKDEREFLWLIKKRCETEYNNQNLDSISQQLKKFDDEKIPEIDFITSSYEECQKYFDGLNYVYSDEFGVEPGTNRLLTSTFIAEIKEKGKKEILFDDKKIDLDYIITKYPFVNLYENFKGLANKLSWYNENEDKVYINGQGIETVLESLNSDTSVVGRLFQQQKEISKDSLMDDYLQSVLTHEAAHKNDNYNHDLTGKEIYAYLNELVYGKTKKGTLANIISLKNSTTKEYKDASDYILGAMSGLGDKPMELWSSHEIKKLAKNALSSYVSALPSKN